MGSNLGNRRENINLAIRKLNSLKATKVNKVSRIIETAPQGGPKGQPKFLNSAVRIRTALSAFELLKKIKIIERSLGRKKTVRFGARTIDLDILFYGTKFINSAKLHIPHKKVFQRDFVLKPLLEIL
ncbi:MAG: 2-amino-4-hydroxy-6-hydroxymethyldihydropteridine diphosphokinase [Candidatus Omnitrophica bacterium]|nr:2-amino-4-hydroxy-6-hydroxymethyldihydropteridine diphosphokinase [Candidatus Omnitrophota bacterium]